MMIEIATVRMEHLLRNTAGRRNEISMCWVMGIVLIMACEEI